MSRYTGAGGGVSSLVVRGAALRAEVVEAVTKATVQLTSSAVSSLTLNITETPDFSLLRSGLFAPGGADREGSQCDLGALAFEVATVEVAARGVDHSLNVTARPVGAQRLRRFKGALSRSNISWTDFARIEAEAAGLRFVGEPSAVLPVVMRQTTPKLESSWDALQRGAKAIGFVCFEAGGTLYFARPTWLVGNTTARAYTWPDERLRKLPTLRRTGDDPANVATLTLEANISEDDVLPGMALDFAGVPTFEGRYLAGTVSFDLLASSSVSIGASTAVDPEVQATPVRSEALTVAGTSAGSTTKGLAAGTYAGTRVDATQAGLAARILAVCQARGLNPRAGLLSLMTAWQESTMRNLSGGDRDSLGLFQQRPSQGWGTRSQISNPEYATGRFLDGLVKIKDWRTGTPWRVIADVQRPAAKYRQEYAKWQATSQAMLDAWSRSGSAVSVTAAAAVTAAPPGAVITISPIVGSQTYRQLQEVLSRGPAHRITSTTGGKHSAGSYHYKGQAVDVAGPRPGRDTAEMLAINRFLAQRLGPHLAELIYAGPGGVCLYRGKPHTYSASTMANHHDHVHVAITPEGLRAAGLTIR